MNKKKEEKKSLKKLDLEWSNLVKKRDGYKCVVCGKTKYINSHHIISRNNNDLRHNIANGITLCAGLHHKFGKNSAHKNGLWFALWLEKNRPEQYEYLKRYLIAEGLI